MKRKFTNYQLPIVRYALLFSALLLVVLASFTVASAQATTPTDDEVNAIARKLYCPVCESTPLDVCPTDACKEWRELIRTMLAEGEARGFQITQRRSPGVIDARGGLLAGIHSADSRCSARNDS